MAQPFARFFTLAPTLKGARSCAFCKGGCDGAYAMRSSADSKSNAVGRTVPTLRTEREEWGSQLISLVDSKGGQPCRGHVCAPQAGLRELDVEGIDARNTAAN